MKSLFRTRVIKALLSVAPECAAIFCLLAVIWWGIFSTLSNQRATLLQTAGRDTANLAHAFQENTQRILAGGDQVLLALRAAYLRDRSSFDLVSWVKHESAPDWLTAQMAVIGPDGMSMWSTASPTRVSVADREHFLVQKSSGGDDLFISRPVLGRSSGRWTIQLTRKIIEADGSFGGIVVLSVDCYELSSFYESLNLEQGSIELFGVDGIVRARGPFERSIIGSHIQVAGPRADMLREQTGTIRYDENREMLTASFRRLPAYPLVVKVAFADKPVLTPYRHARVGMIWLGSLATTVIIGLGFVWVRQRQRSIESQAALSLTLDHMNQGLVMIDERKRVRFANTRVLDLLDLPQNLLTQVRNGPKEQREVAEQRLLDTLHERLDSRPRHQIDETDGRPVLERDLSELPEGGMIQTFTDVTARHLADRRIRFLALHDHLTGLGNRAMFADEADHQIETAERTESSPFGILCLDLNGFKKVNDTLGHDVGDELLIAVSKRVAACLPEGDLVVRSGADEFAVLSRDLDQPAASQRLAERILAILETPFSLSGQQLRVGISIGISLYPEHGRSRDDLLRCADLALSAAKMERTSNVKLFVPAMADGMLERVQLEDEMRTAIESGGFYIEFQPQVRTSSLAPVGFEALVRWNHPRHGNIRPDLFIPMAEETGLIIPLGRQILEWACRAALSWPETMRVAVNLSPVQFSDPQLLATVSSVLEATGLPPSRLELEVTEGVLIADEQQAFEKLSALRELGTTVALDDFGTGYASLSYLRKFPFDKIKLDRSFVQAQVLEPRSRLILKALLGLSRNLQLGVVAEGVETQMQWRLLRDQGCPIIQGFLVGKPMSEQKALDMVGASAADSTQLRQESLV